MRHSFLLMPCPHPDPPLEREGTREAKRSAHFSSPFKGEGGRGMGKILGAHGQQLTFLLAAVACATVLGASSASAQQTQPTAQQATTDAQLLRFPISGYVIGGKPRGAAIKNPYENDRQALVQGRMLFDAMNCSGCHAAEGGGGMGPPLSDNDWIYGDSPGNIYLTISQGRPNGMPSFGNLGSDSIWKLVVYVRSLSGLHQ